MCTSRVNVRIVRDRGAQGGHLDFYTDLELWMFTPTLHPPHPPPPTSYSRTHPPHTSLLPPPTHLLPPPTPTHVPPPTPTSYVSPPPHPHLLHTSIPLPPHVPPPTATSYIRLPLPHTRPSPTFYTRPYHHPTSYTRRSPPPHPHLPHTSLPLPPHTSLPLPPHTSLRPSSTHVPPPTPHPHTSLPPPPPLTYVSPLPHTRPSPSPTSTHVPRPLPPPPAHIPPPPPPLPPRHVPHPHTRYYQLVLKRRLIHNDVQVALLHRCAQIPHCCIDVRLTDVEVVSMEAYSACIPVCLAVGLQGHLQLVLDHDGGSQGRRARADDVDVVALE